MVEVQKMQEQFSVRDVLYAGNAGAVTGIFRGAVHSKKI